MQFLLKLCMALTVIACAANAEAQMRFRGMDVNNDGVITRAEWRGNDRAFRNQDWNGDGVLSGDEVRPGARRQTWSQDWNHDGRVDNLDNQIAQRFRGYDMNGDNRVARGEWPGDGRLFNRLDTNRDGYLTVQEYTSGGGFSADAQGGPAFGFRSLDTNGDGWITRNEWRMGNADFNRLDINRDNRITRFEFEHDTGSYNDTQYAAAQFNAFDANRDGWITRSESRMTNAEFNRIDANNDNRISRFEFENAGYVDVDADAAPRSAAWRMGYDRGIGEGRAAGREDFQRHQGFDLEGQRELANADSGYQPNMGSRSDYQAGYREGFRNAYREGWYNAKEGK
jgi:Ca2+-binding EF-hand superfamily protein